MSFNQTSYDDILAREPADPAAQQGYAELLAIWKDLAARFDAGRDFPTEAEFNKMKSEARRHMTLRERSFFDEPLEPEVVRLDHIQAKMTARLTKILMDRHGFKVARDKGGLGN